ncbi:MAG TPA: glycosyltransferase family 2 protein [Candidatus Acidoferrum sp.]|nr:glycosyltransferase family 2 protein [Candidatus Acidoferrum sp.]
MLRLPTYVLVTPARNEARFIEQTIQAVVAQTVRPLRWIIVSDGSTDATDDIVKRYAADHLWIDLLQMPERQERNFAGKVQAFNAGYAHLEGLEFDVIGNLDSDVSFDAEYFSFLLGKLAKDPRLGLVGTAFKDGSGSTYDYRFVNIEHVTGTCQVFRRQCFEEIGGYVPSKGGAVDSIAAVTARMKGWKTRTFTEKILFHQRSFGTAQDGILMARFRGGNKDYVVGNHPVWELCRTAHQMTKKPLVLGGLMLACGYLWSSIRHPLRPVSEEFVAFHRQEQMRRLRTFIRGALITP